MDEAIRLSPVEKVRLDNVRRYIRRAGSAKKFVAAYDLSPSYISQIAGERVRLPIGGNAARNLEEKLGLELGALDVPIGQQPLASLPRPIAELVEIVQEMDEDEQQRMLAIADALLQAQLARRVRAGQEQHKVELAAILPNGDVPWYPANKQASEAEQLAFPESPKTGIAANGKSGHAARGRKPKKD